MGEDYFRILAFKSEWKYLFWIRKYVKKCVFDHFHLIIIISYLLCVDSMFISVEDRTGGIQLSYNYSMSFTYSQMVVTKQAGDTLYTRSYNLKDQNM